MTTSKRVEVKVRLGKTLKAEVQSIADELEISLNDVFCAAVRAYCTQLEKEKGK